MIFWNRAHRYKPPHRPVLDRSHPLAQGLLGAWVISEGSLRVLNDLVHGDMHRADLYSPVANPPLSLTSDGRGLAIEHARFRIADARLFRRTGQTGVSVVMRCMLPTAGPAVRNIISDTASPSNWKIYIDSNFNRLGWLLRSDAGLIDWRPTETYNYPKDTWFDLAATSSAWLNAGAKQSRLWWRGGAQGRRNNYFVGPASGATLNLGEPSGGYVSLAYVYWWDRGLADREVEWVWEEPFAFLCGGLPRRIFPFIGLPRRLTTTTAVEWRGWLGREAEVLPEWRTGLAGGAPVPVEWLTWLERRVEVALEWRGSAAGGLTVPVDWLGWLGRDAEVLPEWRGWVQGLVSVPVEWLTATRMGVGSLRLAIEWQRGADRRVTLLPAEWAGTMPVGAGMDLPAEWRRGLGSAADPGGAFGGWPIEWTARLVTASGTAGRPVEILKRVRVPFGDPVPGTGGLPVEWLGATALAAGAPLPTEWLAKRPGGLRLPAEWRGTTPLGLGLPLPAEWTARWTRTGRLETEWGGQDPFSLLHRRTILRRLRVPLPHQRRIVESRFRATLAHQRTVRRPLPRLVHSRRILPQGLVAGFSEDVQRVVREADRTP